MKIKNLFYVVFVFQLIFQLNGNAKQDDVASTMEKNFQDYQMAEQELNAKIVSLKDRLSPVEYTEVLEEHKKWISTTKNSCESQTMTISAPMERSMMQQTCLTKATNERTRAMDKRLIAAMGKSADTSVPEVYKGFMGALLSAVDFPVLLPDHNALQKGMGSDALGSLERTTKDSYSVTFAADRACQESHCLKGAFLAYRGTVPDGLLSPAGKFPGAQSGAPLPGNSIELTSGVRGSLETISTDTPFRWLSWCGGSVCYAMTIKNGDDETMKSLANSAIRKGPWH